MKKTLLTGVLALGMAVAAQAVGINGDIGFTGTYTQNGGTSGDLTTATSMTINGDLMINVAHGDLSGAGAPFSFVSPINVNGNLPSLVGATLWTATVGGKLFSFVVTTSVQTLTTAPQLNIAGTGTMDDGAGGFDPTPGTFQLGFGVSGASFTWQSTSASSSIPDGGMTVGLLGLALASLGFVGRRWTSKKE